MYKDRIRKHRITTYTFAPFVYRYGGGDEVGLVELSMLYMGDLFGRVVRMWRTQLWHNYVAARCFSLSLSLSISLYSYIYLYLSLYSSYKSCGISKTKGSIH